ncbi:MAG: S8 family serine peptidase [Clostridia bacterium]|nr:S8 family serine peptidase [Clostridia bacterium]
MLTKLVSLLMSFILPITGFLYTSVNTVIDSVSEMIFGIPYTAEAIKDDFFSEIDDGDIISVDKNSGFVKDLVAVFIDSNLAFKEKLNLFGKTGGVIVGWSTLADLYVIRYPVMSFDSVNDKCDKISGYEGVVYAMPVTTSKTVPDFTPDDPFDEFDFTVPEWDELNPQGSNWWLEAVHARQAWDYSSYFSEINIGIIDAGYDLDHPELDGKIFFPSKRLALRNNQSYHGCHVAGIIGAKHNNGVGIAGICDNSQLICVDWEPTILQFWNTELAIFFGFSELVKSGAKVINLSLGTSGSKSTDGNSLWDEFIVTAAVSIMMSSLLSKGYDFVAVQSAGNGDVYGNPMNANYNGHFAALREGNIITVNGISAEEILDRIIVVASADNAVNGSYIQSGFTNVGKAVSIAAPGSDIYSCSTDGGYEYLSGTSMSAPIVTGVASLVWSVNPELTGADVKNIVCFSTESVAAINRDYEYSYEVDLMDYPMVNAKLAVEEAIRRTDSTVGTVSGKIIGEDAAEIVYNEKSYTLFSDGTYSFVAPASSGTATVLDSLGNTLGEFEINIVSETEILAGDYVINSESDTEPEISETTQSDI